MQVEPSRRIHKEGAVFRATFTGAASVPWLKDVGWLAPGTAHPAIVRCSAFLPPMSGLPEVICLAVKIIDAGDDDRLPEVDQDLTFFAVCHSRALRMVPAVRLHAGKLLLSSVMSYHIGTSSGDRRVVFGARFAETSRLGKSADAYRETVGALQRSGSSLEVLAAPPRQKWSVVGCVDAFHRYPSPGDVIRFRPGHTTENVRLSRFGRVRDRLYRHTQNRGS